MKLLLHTCCGPCVIYPLEVLRQDGFEVEAYFYNPNIYPEEEFLRRKSAFLTLANSQKLTAHIPAYNESEYNNAIASRERPQHSEQHPSAQNSTSVLKKAPERPEQHLGAQNSTSAPKTAPRRPKQHLCAQNSTSALKTAPRRCFDCWGLRLLKTAEFARVNNFPFFTTALLISPYQDIKAIKNIGQRIAQEAGVDFLFRDFRCGFRQAHKEARALGIYTQKYCGCKDSLEERLSKR